MESAGWTDSFDEDDEEMPCFSQDSCVDDLLREAPAGCLYCRLGELFEGDDE